MATGAVSPLMTAILDPEWWRSNPQESYRRLLDHPGLWRDEASGIWAVARHADVLTVERDARTFASRAGDDGQYRLQPSEFEATMISKNDPEHLEQRRLINRRFTPGAMRSHVEHFESLITDLIDRATDEQAAHGSVEVVDALAAQLPCRVTAELLGFGTERWREVKSWSERQMRIDRRFDEPAIYQDLHDSIHEWAAVMAEVLPERAVDPQDDLFSDWLRAGMDPGTMVQETGLMIAGGAETTRTVIAHGLRTFCDHPEAWEHLAEHPDAVDAAVEELIRWVTPLNNMFRTASVDTEVAGTPIAAGDRLALVYPAANRDPAVFDDPDTFDIARSPNHHVAFGHGTHFCLGANMARAELRLLFGELSRRWTNLRVISEPDIEANIFARAVERFQIGFDLR
jgi:cytochrome P450 family 142 subfamily A polypeptide 1